jgi:hypothetical protein
MSLLEAVYSNKNGNMYIIHSFVTLLHTSSSCTFQVILIQGCQYNTVVQTQVKVSKIHDVSKRNPLRLGFEVSFY